MKKIIMFNSRDILLRVDVSRIVYFESDGNYTYVISVNKLKSCLTMNLAHTEQVLASQLGPMANQFMRIGKRYIVNMRYIYQIDVLRQTLTLSDLDKFAFVLQVSKDALKKVKDLYIRSQDSKH